MAPCRSSTRRPALRWVAPLALVVAVGGTTLVAATADADPSLTAKTPEQLLVDLQGSDVTALSGTVVQKAELGLPALPSMGGSGADTSQLMSLLSGSHTLRVWADGPERARFALLDKSLDETDVIVNGRDLWTWSSQDNEATHATLPERPAGDPRPTPEVPTTPQEAAEAVLDAIGPSTLISTDSSVEVADRAARELVLSPSDERSLIGQVRIAVDDATSAPLQVQVLGRDAQVVAQVGFTAVDFTAPDAAQFAFNPPAGAQVTEKGEIELPEHGQPGTDEQAGEHAAPPVTVVGEGWTSVLVADLPDDATSAAGGQLGGVLASLPTVSGSWGSGKLLAGTAFSAVLTDDGRVAVGAVEPQLLYDALAK